MNWGEFSTAQKATFWGSVSLGHDSGCWVWIGKKNNNGYGVYSGGSRIKRGLAHRFAYFFAHGVLPEMLDHACGNRSCVNPRHLRPCSRTENNRNRRLNSNNKHGLKGVSWCARDKRFHACIRVDGKTVNLGYYTTPEEAHAAYAKASVKYHAEFASPTGGA